MVNKTNHVYPSISVNILVNNRSYNTREETWQRIRLT